MISKQQKLSKMTMFSHDYEYFLITIYQYFFITIYQYFLTTIYQNFLITFSQYFPYYYFSILSHYYLYNIRSRVCYTVTSKIILLNKLQFQHNRTTNELVLFLDYSRYMYNKEICRVTVAIDLYLVKCLGNPFCIIYLNTSII